MNLWALALFACRAGAAVMLFNGAQEVLFDGASQACLDLFNTRLDCDSSVQQLTFDLDKLALTQSNLTSLCKPACENSLQGLKAAAQQKCSGYDFYFNGDYWKVEDVVDLFQYKYVSICLQNSNGDFCLVVEESWDVGALDRAGKATWPAYTNKTFPNWRDNEDGSPTTDVDGLLIDDSIDVPKFQPIGVELDKSSSDFYFGGISPDWIGHGWDGMLEYDEYPLEIQCSECFLSQYKHGLESKWGEIYDEVSAQVWSNVRQNCKLDWNLKPAHNFSQHGLQHNITALVWDKPVTCGQNITREEMELKSCEELSLIWSIPSAAFGELNSVNCAGVSNGTFCVPESCDIAVVQSITNAAAFLKDYKNITMTQFVEWNPYVNTRTLVKGETVCVGPAGGKYKPILTTISSTSKKTPTSTTTPVSMRVTTTSATKPANGITTPTPIQPDMVSNCDKFYFVRSGDNCADIASKNGISKDEFSTWNPKVGKDCMGLWADTYACVSIIGHVPVTPTAPHNGVKTPTPTQPSMIGNCNKFQRVKSGDKCAGIASANGISLENFLKWNPKAGNDCKGLWADTYACVGILPAFQIKAYYHNDCTGAVHNDVSLPVDSGGMCFNTGCSVASLDVAAEGLCPNGQIQISYWENLNCVGNWFGYGYASRGMCRRLWTEGWKFRSLHLRCAAEKDDCVNKKTCTYDPEPSKSLC